MKYEELLDKYEQRFEQELTLNKTQTAHARQLISDLMDEAEPEIRREERERFNEAICLVVDVAGLKQSISGNKDILGLAQQAEEVLEALREKGIDR